MKAHQERILLQRDVENIQTDISDKLKSIGETMDYLREHTRTTEVELGSMKSSIASIFRELNHTGHN